MSPVVLAEQRPFPLEWSVTVHTDNTPSQYKILALLCILLCNHLINTIQIILNSFRNLPSSARTYLNFMIFTWSSFLKCRMSVSLSCRTRFTATISFFSLPLYTVPCAPDPTHSMSRMSTNGISH